MNFSNSSSDTGVKEQIIFTGSGESDDEGGLAIIFVVLPLKILFV